MFVDYMTTGPMSAGALGALADGFHNLYAEAPRMAADDDLNPDNVHGADDIVIDPDDVDAAEADDDDGDAEDRGPVMPMEGRRKRSGCPVVLDRPRYSGGAGDGPARRDFEELVDKRHAEAGGTRQAAWRWCCINHDGERLAMIDEANRERFE